MFNLLSKIFFKPASEEIKIEEVEEQVIEDDKTNVDTDSLGEKKKKKEYSEITNSDLGLNFDMGPTNKTVKQKVSDVKTGFLKWRGKHIRSQCVIFYSLKS